MPTTPDEITAFKNKIPILRDLIKEGHYDKARLLRDDIDAIGKFTRDGHYELSAYFNILDAKLLMVDGKHDAAFFILSNIRCGFSGFVVGNSEVLFQYHSAMGLYHMFTNEHALAIESIEKSLVIMKQLNINNVSVYYNLAVCHTAIDKPVKAIALFETTRNMAVKSGSYLVNNFYDIDIATNYSKLRQYDRAEEMLIKALSSAKSAYSELYTAMAYHALGSVYADTKRFDKAIVHFDLASNYYDKTSFNYAKNLLDKSYALIDAGEYSQAYKCIKQGLLESGSFHRLNMLFKSNAYLLNFSDQKALTFIETTTIPDLLKARKLLLAIRYCEFLVNYYMRVNDSDNAIIYSEMANTCYKKFLSEV